MSPEQFEYGLWRIAMDAITRVRMTISGDCAPMLRNLIHTGTIRIFSESPVRGVLTDGQFLDASQNLLMLLGGMITEAKREGLNELREFTLERAKPFFCPLWPFC